MRVRISRAYRAENHQERRFCQYDIEQDTQGKYLGLVDCTQQISKIETWLLELLDDRPLAH